MKNIKIIKKLGSSPSSEAENKPSVITKRQWSFNILVYLFLALTKIFFLEIFCLV